MSRLSSIFKYFQDNGLSILLNALWPAVYDGNEAAERASTFSLPRQSDMADRWPS